MSVKRDCPDCRGNGYITEEVDGALYARPCRCRKVNHAEQVVHRAGIPQRYRFRYDFDHYKPAEGSQEKALALARRYAEEFPAIPEDQNGLMFMGPCGVGKTHLAVAILQDILTKKGIPALFVDLNDLYREIRDTYQPGTEESEYAVLSPLVRSPLLLVDELGCVASPWAQDTLYYLISQRYNEQRATIMTTNFMDSAVTGQELLADRIGQRSRSRLAEMCRTVIVGGPDHRMG